MSKIATIHFNYLRAEAHYEYLELFDQLLGEFPAARNMATPFYPEFTALLAQEKQLIDIQKSSAYTRLIADADHRDDRLITGIRDTVNAALHHFNPDFVRAANNIALRLKVFGEIQAKSYEEEAAAIEILLDDLQSSAFAADVNLIGLAPWLAELRVALNDFKQLLKLRNVETADKPQERLRNVRKQIEAVYRNITDRINSADTIDTSQAYSEFIKRLNALIVYFNDHNHHPAPKSIRNANVDAIPEQAYTGKAITPIPVVQLDGHELFFAKDFSLTYKNNIKAGVAEISIAGKGTYGGQKTVTFNIV